MKKNIAICMGFFWGSMVIFGGCAKEGVVRKDESVAKSTSVTTETRKETVGTEPVKQKTVLAQPISESKIRESPNGNGTEQFSDAGRRTIALESIYFDFDASALSLQARSILARNSELLKKNPSVSVQIEGHCDERGSDEYNLALGEKRAKAALQYLITMGIPEGRLSTISYGKEKPAVAGHDDNAWAKNRRDEFVVSRK